MPAKAIASDLPRGIVFRTTGRASMTVSGGMSSAEGADGLGCSHGSLPVIAGWEACEGGGVRIDASPGRPRTRPRTLVRQVEVRGSAARPSARAGAEAAGRGGGVMKPIVVEDRKSASSKVGSPSPLVAQGRREGARQSERPCRGRDRGRAVPARHRRQILSREPVMSRL